MIGGEVSGSLGRQRESQQSGKSSQKARDAGWVLKMAGCMGCVLG